jgi:beta-glucosidase
MISRRSLVAASSAGAALAAAPVWGAATRPAPPGFLWGTAISGHQSEGNDTNSDTWLLENLTPTVYAERSGDACDSYHRFGEDIALNARLGFNCYRFGVEWSRIEPNEGFFSNAELDHYARVLDACLASGQTPIVTLSHFSVPRWFAERGGWEREDAPDLFARYCARVARAWGDRMGRCTTFNEANVQLLVKVMGAIAPPNPKRAAMLEAARRATGSPRFSSLAYADPDICQPILLEAHRRGFQALKAERAALQVGLSLTTQEIAPHGAGSIAPQVEAALYGDWIVAAKDSADFTGVQTYTRLLVDGRGVVPWPRGTPLTGAAYEYRPQALAATIRWAHRAIGKPIYVTESGIATDDDAQRVAFIDAALAGVRGCLEEGIPVHSYLYWSLLDNFEWTSGYSKRFGLVAVDRRTFARAPKASALHLGAIARSGSI